MIMVTEESSVTVAAGDFKARCLKLLDVVSQTRRPITITKRGKPVARLVPIAEEKPRKLFGHYRGHVLREEDIVGPTGESWEADNG